MKKFFSFLLAALCLSTQAYADKVTASTTLPQNGNCWRQLNRVVVSYIYGKIRTP